MTYFYKQNKKRGENNNNNFNNNRRNILTNDMEIELEHEADAVQIIIKEKCNKMEKSNQERGKIKVLELENEAFRKIMWDYAIEVNKIKRILKRKKGIKRNKRRIKN